MCRESGAGECLVRCPSLYLCLLHIGFVFWMKRWRMKTHNGKSWRIEDAPASPLLGLLPRKTQNV